MSHLISALVYLLAAGLGCGLLGWMVACMRRPFETNPDRSTAAMGGALQELDRLVARPSIEHKVELESQVNAVKDDQGDDWTGPKRFGRLPP